MKKIRVALAGYGERGSQLSREVLVHFLDDVHFVAVCDKFEDRAEAGAEFYREKSGEGVSAYTDYATMLEVEKPDAVIIAFSWRDHVPCACLAMEQGVAVAMEVGGAYAVEQCWELVRTWERTRTPFMFLENCCYGRLEMAALEMKKSGFLGSIMHCSGGYCHDLRWEISNGKQRRHYRFDEYTARNGENYPSHEFLPLARMLDLHKGNRPLTLYTAVSGASGLQEYSRANYPSEHIANHTTFAQGDIATTVIRFAGGETLTLTLDTTLPRAYSRGFTVRGTKAAVFEDTASVFEDGKHNEYDFTWNKQWNNIEEYYKRFDSEVWKKFQQDPVGSHGGMDYLEFADFFTCLREGKPMPIDVYDAAVTMAITPLSEMSVALGSPVAIPDFTCGGWIKRCV
jgi:predicted dehydrogenase